MKSIFNTNKERTILIVGINLGMMIFYTLFFRFMEKGGGIYFTALVLAFHIILCLIISPFIYKKGFLLSALALLLIGFSTCYIVYTTK